MFVVYRPCLVTSFTLIATLLFGCAGTQSQSVSVPSSREPVSATVTISPVPEVKLELERYFQESKGAFVLYDLNSNRYIRYNPERCAERFIPASTFKIMNSLIGLETGVIPDQDYVIKWDGRQNYISSWNQDHTLKTAMENSVVWYYQELARRVGSEKMQYYLDLVEYGNQDLSGSIDTFWLEGGLKISADEQVEILQRLYLDQLPFSKRSMDITKEILVLEKTQSYQLSGKTGSAQRVVPPIGWFVGYLETKGNIYFFATNYESVNKDGMLSGMTAKNITMDILKDLELLP